ncbi:SDR family NAD(P)-dependent oxidoreductase [Aquamicrobium sp. LC103]|uniref:SDR family oxidoreductase n=1 Tax=Aquamicrobium sp. LC103 TaxID=1120658 RepID=UPI00063E7E3A|nr:SDR family NAD(P)-dependent oxidoreductase [Aquamicrobium sp. LC103]TKT69247.1 SDR family oxidoreductase [Aquamicrobium sp. LC103]
MVIGGGGGGIGSAVARTAREEGARVVVWDVASKPSQAGADDVVCDLTNEAAIASALNVTLERTGHVDCLVNCVGVTGPTAPVENYELDDWQRVIALNLTSTFLSCRALIAPMKVRGYGRIVNLASVAGKEGNPNQAAYSASKAAVIGFTKSLGKELAHSGVLVNCVAPAIIETDLIFQMTKAQRALVLDKVPMGRMGQPGEIAELVVWLASARCSFSTGATFDISGGRATY